MENCPKLTTNLSTDEILINKDNFLIGRGVHCDYVITILGVSRSHCAISLIDNNWQLIDKSTNGTKLNEQQLNNGDSVPLKNGDLIKIGSLIFLTFHFENEDVAQPKTKRRRLESTELIEIPVVQEIINENPEKNDTVQETEKKDEKTVLANNDNSVFEEFYCSICSELFIKAVTLNCSHTYCQYCIDVWKKNKMDCPICRTKITAVTPTLIIDNLVEKIISGKSELRNDRLALIKERESLITPNYTTNKGPETLLQVNNNIQIEIINDSDDDDIDGVDDDNDDVDGDDVDDVDSDDDDDVDEDDYDSFFDYYEYEGEDDDIFATSYNGIPGAYFGGYGRCYFCGDKGHWANGCPHK